MKLQKPILPKFPFSFQKMTSDVEVLLVAGADLRHAEPPNSLRNCTKHLALHQRDSKPSQLGQYLCPWRISLRIHQRLKHIPRPAMLQACSDTISLCIPLDACSSCTVAFLQQTCLQ
jgi:hypothetical protein